MSAVDVPNLGVNGAPLILELAAAPLWQSECLLALRRIVDRVAQAQDAFGLAWTMVIAGSRKRGRLCICDERTVCAYPVCVWVCNV